MKNDGFSLDDKRTPLGSSDLDDVLSRWMTRSTAELTRVRTDQSFCVPRSEIEANDYDLSLNRYKEIQYDEVDHQSPEEILGAVGALEADIIAGIAELRELLK